MSGYGETWSERKRQRSIDYWRRYGIGMHTCTACSGSGHYDNHGSPDCGACDGTGKVRGRLNNMESALQEIEAVERRRRIKTRRALRVGGNPNLEIKMARILSSSEIADRKLTEPGRYNGKA
jgi:hypothetical protein